MSERLIAVGRVGRAHGVDGSFYVEDAEHLLPEGLEVMIAGAPRRIVRRAGTDRRPLVRVEGIDGREAARALRAETLRLPEAEAPLAEGEWLVADLVGCAVPGLGEVRSVITGPSCDVLEVAGTGDRVTLVPLVSDAVTSVDLEARELQVDLRFLGVDPDTGEGA